MYNIYTYEKRQKMKDEEVKQKSRDTRNKLERESKIIFSYIFLRKGE